MLYIWPYTFFFSFPTILPTLLPALISSTPQFIYTLLPQPPTRSQLPRLVVLVPLVALALATIRYNTLVHPFTLADNRHYTFYVFRLLRRGALTRYLVAPVYVLLGWASVAALAEPVAPTSPAQSSSVPRSGDPPAPSPRRVSFVIVWLATSSLSLVTAPLVEPRYFILPWVVWRLNVPSPVPGAADDAPRGDGKAGAEKKRARGESWLEWALRMGREHALGLETAWFLAVNAGTGYVFLRRGFAWEQAPGEVQRFMW